MKPSNVAIALRTLIEIRRPAFLWGAPGIGKSQLVAQAAAALKRQMADVRAILLDPVDLRGLPAVVKGRVEWATPGFLPTKGDGVLFLDELNAAPPMVQAACYQLILDRKLGEYELPPGWAVMAAGNRDSDRAVTSRMPSALANRLVHIDVDVDVDDWTKWALDAGIQPELVAFIRFRPNLLHVFDPAAKAFPTPRAWATVSEILAATPDAAIEFDLISGTVGPAAAAEVIGFLKVFRQLPSPDAVLLNPAKAIVPTDPAAQYAICGALSRRASPDNFDRITTYADRLPREFGVLLILDAVTLQPAAQNTGAFIKWSAANADVLI